MVTHLDQEVLSIFFRKGVTETLVWTINRKQEFAWSGQTHQLFVGCDSPQGLIQAGIWHLLFAPRVIASRRMVSFETT